MAIAVAPLEASHLPALRRFCESVWQRPTSDAYYRWRYQGGGFHRAWVALRDDEVIAMEAAIQRPWRMGDRTVEALEVFDWYARPELRNTGVGVRVMQALMKEPVPLMLVGGSDDTRTLLPRLKWTQLATSRRFVLALGADRTREALERRLGLPGPFAKLAAEAAVRRPGQRPRPRAVPRGGRVWATAGVGDEIQSLYEGDLGYGCVPRWSPALLGWLLCGFPGVGHFLPLYFSVEGRLVGWSLLRIHASPQGCDAEIIELYAPRPDAAIFTWMISETAVRAAAFGPGVLAGRTTCEAAALGFERNRFRRISADPVNFWLGDRPPPPGPFLIGSNTNDAAIVPMVERWWDRSSELPAR